MAGQGRAPKPPEQRRNRTKPSAGEWREIPWESGLKVPKMPAAPKGGWRAATRRAWSCWWADGAASLWGPAEVELLETLVRAYDRFARGDLSVLSELRLRQDALGLTPKGKQQLRWRRGEGEAVETAAGSKRSRRPAASRRKHLKVV